MVLSFALLGATRAMKFRTNRVPPQRPARSRTVVGVDGDRSSNSCSAVPRLSSVLYGECLSSHMPFFPSTSAANLV